MTSPGEPATPDPRATRPGPPPTGREPLLSAGPLPERPRPFVLTAGRVESADPEIGMDTQVRSCPPPAEATAVGELTSEQRAIIALCAETLSVAEISARVPLHLGVTKVLVGDLRTAGYLQVHSAEPGEAVDPELVVRVLEGLRALQ